MLYKISVADPDFYPSRIQKQQQKRGVKKKIFQNFLCSHKFLKIENYFSFKVLKKKIWANFHRIIEFLTPKIVTKLSKIWVWDPRSGIRKKNYSGSQIQGSKRHQILDPQHCIKFCFMQAVRQVVFTDVLIVGRLDVRTTRTLLLLAYTKQTQPLIGYS
jgi:hypothetical protein